LAADDDPSVTRRPDSLSACGWKMTGLKALGLLTRQVGAIRSTVKQATHSAG